MDPELSEFLFAVFGLASVFGLPFTAWFISSRRRFKREMASLSVAREQEITRRRQLELEYDLRQRQLTERLYDQALRDHDQVIPEQLVLQPRPMTAAPPDGGQRTEAPPS